MKNNKIVILLTACVNPDGMSFTKLQNMQERILQYNEAVSFYLKETPYDIVVVENTFYDIGFIDDDRIEYITFSGNDYDKSLGKGYGEALIIEHALRKSLYLSDADYVVKITGRLQVENILKIIKSLDLIDRNSDNVVFSNITWNMKFCYSHFFIASKIFFEKFVESKKYINDSESIYLEHILMKVIIKWKKSNNNFFVFKLPIIINGLSGSTGKQYTSGVFLFFLRITQYFKSFYFNFFKQWK